MNVIYQPKGRALEYSELACNLYMGCAHGCKYCFAPACMRTSMGNWHSNPRARENIIPEFKKDAAKLAAAGDRRPILFSFLSDPYQPLEASRHLTRQALEIVDDLKLRSKILTKGSPELIVPDLPLIAHAGVELGITLSFADDRSRQEWEPHAASVQERMELIKRAHGMGIKTWVSMEPVIVPDEALEVLRQMMPYVDLWKIGKLNHYKQIEKSIDWVAFREQAKGILDKASAKYYIKKDLAEYK
jgi:DNA repair photolyase